MRAVLVLSFLFLLQPLHVSAQTGVADVEPCPPATLRAGWYERAASPEVPRLLPQQPAPRKRSWIGRHPVLFGALVGFGGGFLIGYLPGDDGVFDDFTAEFNGLVLGGIGAGAGAVVGAVAGAATK